MEEYIKILEELLENANPFTMRPTLYKAIDNIIKGYKERDAEINKLNKVIDEMAEHIVNSAVVDDTVCCLKVGCEDKECNYEEMLSCTKKYFIEEVENG